VKRIVYSLRCGVIGLKEFSAEIFRDYLKSQLNDHQFIPGQSVNERAYEFFILYRDLPFKIEITFFENGDMFLENRSLRDNYDVICFLIEAQTTESSDNLKTEYKQIKQVLSKDIMYVLIGFTGDLNRIVNSEREHLISIGEELDFLYVFLLEYQKPDISQIFKKIFRDFTFQFKFSSPELFERAKAYGEKMREEKNKFFELN
jgi:hypothetical protein